jgi:hypothetical protein
LVPVGEEGGVIFSFVIGEVIDLELSSISMGVDAALFREFLAGYL